MATMADVFEMWVERLSNLEHKMDFIVKTLVNQQRNGRICFEHSSGKHVLVDLRLCREVSPHGVYVRWKETKNTPLKVSSELADFVKTFFPNEYTVESLSKLQIRDIFPNQEDMRGAIHVVLSEYYSQKGMADYIDDEFGVCFDDLGEDVYTAIQKACMVWDDLGILPKEIVVEPYGHLYKEFPSRFARLAEILILDLAKVSLSSTDKNRLSQLANTYLSALRWRRHMPDIPRCRGLSFLDMRDRLEAFSERLKNDS